MKPAIWSESAPICEAAVNAACTSPEKNFVAAHPPVSAGRRWLSVLVVEVFLWTSTWQASARDQRRSAAVVVVPSALVDREALVSGRLGEETDGDRDRFVVRMSRALACVRHFRAPAC